MLPIFKVLRSAKLNYTEEEKVYPVILEEREYTYSNGAVKVRPNLILDVPSGVNRVPCPKSYLDGAYNCSPFQEVHDYDTYNDALEGLLKEEGYRIAKAGGRRRTNRRNRKYKNRRSMRR